MSGKLPRTRTLTTYMKNLITGDMQQCADVRRLYLSQGKDYTKQEDWRLLNWAILGRARLGLKKSRRFIEFSFRRSFPKEYSFLVHVMDTCGRCARGMKGGCPFIEGADRKSRKILRDVVEEVSTEQESDDWGPDVSDPDTGERFGTGDRRGG